jgi:chromatin assembly factor 1 subunit B
MNEYVATQSSDRTVHVYSLKTKDGRYTLDAQGAGDQNSHNKVAAHHKMDHPSRRISSHSPAPPDFAALRAQAQHEPAPQAAGSPAPSAPGTPMSFALPMNPPSVISHSRRSSFGSSPSMRRSASPAPSMPLPAVKPMEASPKPYTNMGSKAAYLYANETLTSFFRRLTFTPDGSLLLTPAAQHQTQHQATPDSKIVYDIINTVYIHTRAGLSKDPLCHLPGLKKPAVVIKCSPIIYTIRKSTPTTKHITIDTSSADDSIPSLPEPVMPSKPGNGMSIMEPPPLVPQTSDPTSAPAPKPLEVKTSVADKGPPMAFALPYRMIYAVATQDSVMLYDTQQQTPICVVSNLHCATFTDLAW